MTEYTQHDYQVTWSDGEVADVTAHMIYQNSAIIGLKKAPGDNPDNLIFAASHQAGVTIGLADNGPSARAAAAEYQLRRLRELFQRRWVCNVQASGHHNGATCDSQDPHVDWGCAYHWTTAPISDSAARSYGLTSEDAP